MYLHVYPTTQCFAAGWVYKIEEQIASLGAAIVLAHIVAFFGPVILACGLWFGLSDTDIALWVGFVGLVCFYVLGMAVVVSCFSNTCTFKLGMHCTNYSTLYSLIRRRY